MVEQAALQLNTLRAAYSFPASVLQSMYLNDQRMVTSPATSIGLVRPEHVACKHLVDYVLNIFSHPVSNYQVGLGFKYL